MEFERILSENDNDDVLDNDVLVEVLSRLPADAVIRFKSVSTHWRRLLSSPYFFCRYAAVNGRLLAFFQKAAPVHERWEPAEAMPCNTLPLRNKLITESNIPKHMGHFINSSNGLILFGRPGHGRHQIIYHVGNPLTGKFVELPPPAEGRRGFVTFKYGQITSLLLPSLKSSVLICEEGNSYGAPAYTVLRAGKINKHLKPQDYVTLYIESYSSRTGKWSPITQLAFTSQTPMTQLARKSQMFQKFYLSDQPAVVANGVVHWYTWTRDVLVYDPKGDHPKLQFINTPKIKERLKRKWCSFTRTYDGVMWLGLTHRRGLTFYMMPKQGATECVDAKEWVEMAEVTFDKLSRMMKKGLVACNYKEVTLECLITESESGSGSEVVAVLQQRKKVFLYNVHRESLVKVDYLGRYNKDYYLCPYLQPSSPSSYCL